jgi:hypothetical protein
LIPALWFAALAVGFGINPKRLHLFAVLSVASISADFWWHLISRLLLFPLPARSFDKWDLVRVVLYTIVPLSIASLGLLPAGRLARRVTS